MSSKKTQETKQTQTQNNQFDNKNTYDFLAPPDTADTSAFRAWRPEKDQSIGYGAANSKNQLASSYNNPLGGYNSASMRDAGLRGGNRQIDQDASQSFRVGQNDVNQQRMGQLGALANMTAPRMVQTGSSGTSAGQGSGNSSTVATTPALDNILSGAGSAAMM